MGPGATVMAAFLSKRTGLPTVSTVHSDYRLDYLGRPLSRLTYGTINTLALRKLDYRIGVSDAMVDLLISRKFDPERLFSIYNGLDFTPRTPAMNRAEYLRSVGLEADETCVVAGIAARLNPRQRHRHTDSRLCQSLQSFPRPRACSLPETGRRWPT